MVKRPPHSPPPSYVRNTPRDSTRDSKKDSNPWKNECRKFYAIRIRQRAKKAAPKEVRPSSGQGQSLRQFTGRVLSKSSIRQSRRVNSIVPESPQATEEVPRPACTRPQASSTAAPHLRPQFGRVRHLSATSASDFTVDKAQPWPDAPSGQKRPRAHLLTMAHVGSRHLKRRVDAEVQTSPPSNVPTAVTDHDASPRLPDTAPCSSAHPKSPVSATTQGEPRPSTLEQVHAGPPSDNIPHPTTYCFRCSRTDHWTPDCPSRPASYAWFSDSYEPLSIASACESAPPRALTHTPPSVAPHSPHHRSPSMRASSSSRASTPHSASGRLTPR